MGYVQVRRTRSECTLRATICPEQKVHSKPYSVTIIINEQNSAVKKAECRDCVASYGII